MWTELQSLTQSRDMLTQSCPGTARNERAPSTCTRAGHNPHVRVLVACGAEPIEQCPTPTDFVRAAPAGSGHTETARSSRSTATRHELRLGPGSNVSLDDHRHSGATVSRALSDTVTSSGGCAATSRVPTDPSPCWARASVHLAMDALHTGSDECLGTRRQHGC